MDLGQLEMSVDTTDLLFVLIAKVVNRLVC